MIPIAKPILGDDEIDAVVKVLRSGFLAEGQVSRDFEMQFSKYIGTEFATVATNGTTALSTALEAMGIQPGDEIITTPFTFIASANTIAMVGAIPVFVDVDPHTYNISPEAIEAAVTEKTTAIMPVHIFGMPCDMKRIMEIAQDKDLLVIEDACQAHGASIDGKMAGSWGNIAAFSFYATKNMMTGEGGMITTNDEEIYENALMIKNHGRGKQGGYSHFRIGYNNRMMDLVSAIGIQQLRHMPNVLESRRRNAQHYNKILQEIETINPQREHPGFKSAYHVYGPLINHSSISRDNMVRKLQENGIGSRTVYALPCHKQDTYRNINEWRWARYVDYPDYSTQSFPNAELIGARHFEIPVHPGLSEDDLEQITSALLNILA